MSTSLVPIGHGSLVVAMAQRYGLQPDKFLQTIKSTVFPSDRQASDEQLAAFLTVAKQYDLNPFIKEIYALPAKGGGIVPIVSIDGWCSLINRQPQLDGIEFVDDVGENGKLVSVTCKIFRKDRSHATCVTEYMSECMRGTDTWAKYPFRMLRHKALIQCARYAFALSGIYDPDEAERIPATDPDKIYYENTEERTKLITGKLAEFNAQHKDPEKRAESPSGASEVSQDPEVPPATPKAQEPPLEPPQSAPPAPPPPEKSKQEPQASPESEVVTQEVLVTDVEQRTKDKKSYLLLTCSIEGTSESLSLLCWHKNTMFDALKRSLDKRCVFGVSRHEGNDNVWYTIEQIDRIGDQVFIDNKPPAQPTAKELFS